VIPALHLSGTEVVKSPSTALAGRSQPVRCSMTEPMRTRSSLIPNPNASSGQRRFTVLRTPMTGSP